MSALASFNGLQRFWTSHVLLYHGTYPHVPTDLEGALHNVTPNVLREQQLWLKKNFNVVPLETLSRSQKTGLAAITFDDAYSSVFAHALPVLRELGLPCTIFINGCTLSGEVFWRDKVRYILTSNRTEEFLAFLQKKEGTTWGITRDNFYRRTKHNEVNSKRLSLHIDTFLSEQTPQPLLQNHCVQDPATLIKDPLVSYGSHGFHHYVLSSLTKQEQEEELAMNERLFQKHGLTHSPIFSVPFGGERDFNVDTVELLQAHGYEGIVYSRHALNTRRSIKNAQENLSSLERYMPVSSMQGFQRQVASLGFKSMFS